MIKKQLILSLIPVLFSNFTHALMCSDHHVLASRCYQLRIEILNTAKHQDTTKMICRNILEHASDAALLAAEQIDNNQNDEARKTLKLTHSIMEVSLKEKYQCKEQETLSRLISEVDLINQELQCEVRIK